MNTLVGAGIKAVVPLSNEMMAFGRDATASETKFEEQATRTLVGDGSADIKQFELQQLFRESDFMFDSLRLQQECAER